MLSDIVNELWRNPYYQITAATVPITAYLIYSLFARFKAPRIRNFFKGFKYSAQVFISWSNPEAKRKASLGMLEIVRNPLTSKDEVEAQYYLKKGDIVTALQFYQRSINFSKDVNRRRDPLTRLCDYLSTIYYSCFLDKKQEDRMEHALMLLSQKKYSPLFKTVWPKILATDSSNGMQIIHALFLNASGRTAEAQEAWKSLAGQIMNDDSVNKLKRITESSNEVMEYAPDPVLKSAVLLKRNALSSLLRREYAVTNRIYSALEERAWKQKLDSSFIKVSQMLLLFEHGQYTYLVSQRINQKESLVETKQCIDTCAKIHGIVTPDKVLHLNLPKYDYISVFISRLVNRLGINDKLTRLIGCYNELVNTLTASPVSLIHADCYQTNFLADGTLLDWEKASYGNPMLDVSAILLDFDEGLLKDYRSLLGHYSEKKQDKNITQQFYRNLVHNVLCLIGSSFHRKDIASALGYYEKAKWILCEPLKSLVVDYVRHSQLKAWL